MVEPEYDYAFPKLQVINISFNNFVGYLPSKYFQSWHNATRYSNEDEEEYIGKYIFQNN